MEDIVRDGHPALRKKSEDVSFPLNEEEKDLLNKMTEFLKNSQDDDIAEKYKLRSGVGLAAPQLGINKRLIAIYFEDGDKMYDLQLVNPKIISHSVEQAYLANGEGCLSVDRDVPGYVPRHARITVKFKDAEGKEHKMRLKGIAAIAFQHELDHLNGVMFYDRIDEKNPFAEIPNASAYDR